MSIYERYTENCKGLSLEPHAAVLSILSAVAESGQPLTRLNLRGSQKQFFNSRLDDTQIFAICDSLYEESSLALIDLSFNNLKDASANAIARLIKMNSSIQMVNLAGNEISSVGLVHICEALSSPEASLAALLLTGNPVGDAGALALAEMLNVNESLKILDLGNTQMGEKGMIGLCVVLTEGNCTLTELDLEAPLLPNPQYSIATSMARMLKANNSLTRLGLAKNKLVDSQFETLLEYGLVYNKSLTSLNLRCNNLSAFSGPLLERLLTDCPHMTSLNLASNKLGDGGAMSICRALPYTHWLARLDLRANNIGEVGLSALAESLSLASHLQLLLVWGNTFGAAASRAFRDTLSQPAAGQLRIDIQPYEVDGVAAVALKDVVEEV